MRPASVGEAAIAQRQLVEAQQSGDPFSLVLIDAKMPRVDGFSLVEQIKNSSNLTCEIIMMLTSGDRPAEIAKCEQLGVTAYLLKPVKQSELFDATAMVLGVTAPESTALDGMDDQESRVPPLRVLLVEDSLVNQKLAVALLESHGHTVVLAGDGRQAIAAHETREFDLILMDVEMPEMDGFEATAAIRAREKHLDHRTPIIAMTAHAMKGDRERCLEAGMDAYVPKPVRSRHLFSTISAVVKARDSAS
jgi:CheY-like chemotaxis protein